MINETTEGQEAGEQREELFFKVIEAGNKILEILAALFIILMLLYGAYSLWDTCQINRRAFISGELMKYKPAGKTDESPSLQELQKINPDVCAWLTVDGTKIDYPVVQGETNLEYINQDIYGEFALSGSIFLDSRNDRKFIDSYSLLYGHHMDNGAMFGDVMNYKEKEYFESHKTGTLYLNEQLEKIQWFACVETDAYDEVIYNPQDYKKENLEELMEYIKGPDFPTGATILGKSGIRAAYRTGRGKILVRSTAEIQPMGNGREKIVVTEIPYMVNKLRLIEKIAELVKEKRVDGISDLYDASAGDDIQIIIELKKDANANVILNQLYKYTQLQESFGAIMIALVNGKPAVLNLQQMLSEYLKHQEEVVTRRTKFNLDKAEKRAHILEGLRIAISNIDEVIRIIRTSYDNAKERLMERFGLSEIQAQAILEMQLRRLQGLEHEKIDAEYKDLQEKIAYYKSLLADEAKLLGVIRDEMQDIKNKYADPRRTQLVANPGEIDVEDLIDEETCVFTLSNLNYVKRTPLMTYKSQNRGGRGIVGMQTRDEDFVKDLFLCSTHDTILFFTDHGRVYRLKGYEVPEAGRTARGMAIVNLLEIAPDESVTAVIPVKEFREDRYLVMLTKQGLIKKTDMASYSNIRKGGLIAINLREDDSLISVMTTEGEDEILAATRNGMGIRFSEKDVRPMGRTATGVKAISLREGDYLVSAIKMSPTAKVLNVTEKGFGKQTLPEEFKVQYRGGMGVKIHQLTEKTGLLTGVLMLEENEEIMLITSEGVIIRLRGADISTIGRVSQGVKLMNLDEGVSVVGIAKITEDDIESEEEELAEMEEKAAAENAENEEITVSEDTEA